MSKDSLYSRISLLRAEIDKQKLVLSKQYLNIVRGSPPPENAYEQNVQKLGELQTSLADAEALLSSIIAQN